MRHSISALFLILAVSLIAACAPSSTVDAGPSASVELQGLDSAKVLVQGTLSGRNDHVVAGGVQVVEMDGQRYLRLNESFSLDGAPDPKIGFGTSGEYDTTTTFTVLKKKEGAQDYVLPAELDLGRLNEAYIWCDDFSVALGVAGLNP